MKLTLKYKQDLLELLGEIQLREEIAGRPFSDSAISKAAFGYGDFIGILRNWEGFKKSPTMENMAKLERFLRDQIGEKDYDSFIKKRGYKSAADLAFDD